MRKLSLLVLALLLSAGVFAQTTTPTATPTTTSANKTPKVATATSNGTAKNKLKKAGPNKKVAHHVTPVKKSGAPAQPKGATQDDSKK